MLSGQSFVRSQGTASAPYITYITLPSLNAPFGARSMPVSMGLSSCRASARSKSRMRDHDVVSFRSSSGYSRVPHAAVSFPVGGPAPSVVGRYAGSHACRSSL